MDRMAEVKERLKIMEDAGMISCGVSEFCMMAAGLILAEHPGADSDKLNMLITHLALAGERMKKGDTGEMQISQEVLDTVKEERVYPQACGISRKILECTTLKFTQAETDFLTVHLCNILM